MATMLSDVANCELRPAVVQTRPPDASTHSSIVVTAGASMLTQSMAVEAHALLPIAPHAPMATQKTGCAAVPAATAVASHATQQQVLAETVLTVQPSLPR